MTPLALFQQVKQRCDEIKAIHSYFSSNITSALNLDELLRAEWVGYVGALDLYIHELTAQKMAETFDGTRRPTDAFNRFELSNGVLQAIRNAPNPIIARSAFELEVRTKLSKMTFQLPDKIADAIRLISDVELWNEVATNQGATSSTQNTRAKNIKTTLSLIVDRRNKIAHEGDLQPGIPRVPWPIMRSEVNSIQLFITGIVNSIDAII